MRVLTGTMDRVFEIGTSLETLPYKVSVCSLACLLLGNAAALILYNIGSHLSSAHYVPDSVLR